VPHPQQRPDALGDVSGIRCTSDTRTTICSTYGRLKSRRDEVLAGTTMRSS
jgi:hypothetical protein